MPKTKSTPDPLRERNLEALKEMPEVCVFMAAYYGISEIKSGALADLAERAGAQEQELSEATQDLIRTFHDTVEVTYRFGVLMPISYGKKGKVIYSPFFWRWFNWWMDWLIIGHTPADLVYLKSLADNRLPELEEWRPPGHWITYRKDPILCPC